MFYDPVFYDRNTRVRPERREPLRTSVIDNGYLVQNSEGERASYLSPEARAAQVAATLPSNQPTAEQGRNWIQGLANSSRQQNNWEPESLLKNPNWNMLYAVDPTKANIVYKNATGRSFDEVLGERKSNKEFAKKTVQQKIASNTLRQDERGQWFEYAGKNDPNDPLAKSEKDWLPASLQTLDLVNRAGDFGTTNFKTLKPVDLFKKMVSLGIDPKEADRQIRTQMPTPAQAKVGPPASEVVPPSGHIPGLVGLLGQAANAPMPAFAQQAMDFNSFGPNEQAAVQQIGPNILNNLKALIMGGNLKSLNPEVTNENYQRLLPILQRR